MNLSSIPVVKLPLIDLSTDPLDLTVTGIVLRMKQLAKTSPKFIELTHDQQVRIQLSTKQGFARQIIINQGKVDTVSGQKVDADFNLIFQDSDHGVKILMKGDSSVFMAGLKDKSIAVDGELKLLVLFSKIMQLLPPKMPKPVEQKIKQARVFIRRKLGR
ncbi:SCP-2 sterol transfer family protein [Acinetobacter sp. B5B]|uniref:SCP-2 sterol transfer family protein n=1 Tax=Acinetobacter baretiae TaxID=2605383 RepID=UPI0018C300D7|nr:SCP-2 sterol transfer family protein [Acinetobacter baretiae]MBF7681873.1 SCP-2 sterol transfer family protein [Acinetobacter baretiae]MBF7685753.1 SCP-2 sterol transfer family protein [Acinetobacter baretiae]